MNVSPSIKMSATSRYLTVWIFAAMAAGIALGNVWPGLGEALDSFSYGTTSIPLAIGLILMMYGPLAKVRYNEIGRLRHEPSAPKMFSASLILNWMVGPLLMFALAWLFFPDNPEYRVGLILIGLARCIAMVLIWNQLADGDNEYAAILVAFNSVFQIFLYSAYVFFFVTLVSEAILPGSGLEVDITMMDVAESVLVYLGLPFLAGMLTRYICVRRKGQEWYESRITPVLGRISLMALLFTIVVMFTFKSDAMLELPLDVVMIAIPLLIYFVVMFIVSFAVSWKLDLDYPHAVSQSFTAASNNFELAIAVAIGVFGIGSGVAFAAVVGPLIEVPVMIALVNLAFWFRRRFYGPDDRPVKT